MSTYPPLRSLLTTTFLLSLCSPPSAFAAIIVTYPAGTLLENVAVAPSGDLYVTALDSGSVFRVTPSGTSQLFGQVPGPAAGIALDSDGTPVVASGTSLYRLAPNGIASLASDVPGSLFLNGIALFSPGVFLAADDTANTIWRVDLAGSSSQAWSTDPLLVPGPAGAPFSPNGIKLFQGAVYVSNTGSGTIVRIPILPNGLAGTAEIYLSSIFVDDFAFGTDGTLFAATQFGEIIRVAPDGTRTSLPTGTLGDAAVAFGRTAADRQSIYAVNNGGAFLGLPGGPEEASVVRLDVGIDGVVPEEQAIPEPSSLVLSVAGIVGLFLVLRKKHYLKGRSTKLVPAKT